MFSFHSSFTLFQVIFPLTVVTCLQLTVNSKSDLVERAKRHEDLQGIYEHNLERDFALYRSASYGASDLLRMIESALQGRAPKHLTLLAIKNREVYPMPLTEVQPKLASRRVAAIVEGLVNASKEGVTFEDTILLLNTWDEPKCANMGACPAPVFSLIKQWNWDTESSPQNDVLIPFFNHQYGDTISYPTQHKVAKALMRAAVQNGMRENCTRLWLLELAKTDLGQKHLDVGITNNLKKGFQVQLVPFVEMAEHAKWRYLISTDGFTASCRFGKLLQINSLVLKEESTWIEYYYRSVKPGVHFISFNKDNVLKVLQELEHYDDAQVLKMTNSAQDFSHIFLSQYAKALYVSRAIHLYNKQFKEVERMMSQIKSSDLGNLHTALNALKLYASSG
ncbi:hypothetical protein CEUSTIGMA_g8895.t1 [Chlamydomonas eustigma]|uniref:Glycosyl transferase CAP10 domain-containing protein n=1 Tax=Chlamydomonas eustigma TaxID=1157962 RepID=A0A250XEK1_9CHLO|nr:hypothetical protein CEUSTIGMA_g8895.t1 [Chlamydomonas eustigma]|eukprot:GAX81466.1 hypothetical protein CEUSTIGMA_g8895.t1 [Chlamydomonas eustigma]